VGRLHWREGCENLKYVELKLTKGFVSKVDESDFARITQFKWQSQKTSGDDVYAGASIKDESGKWRRVLLHRFVMNAPRGMVIDHINGDKLDNRKSNLRICNQVVNRLNSKGSGKSKYKGVSLRNRASPWMASIKLPDGEYKNLGSYKNEIDAARAYNEYAKKIYGDLVLLNDLG